MLVKAALRETRGRDRNDQYLRQTVACPVFDQPADDADTACDQRQQGQTHDAAAQRDARIPAPLEHGDGSPDPHHRMADHGQQPCGVTDRGLADQGEQQLFGPR